MDEIQEFVVEPLDLWAGVSNPSSLIDLVQTAVGSHPLLLQHFCYSVFLQIGRVRNPDLMEICRMIVTKDLVQNFGEVVCHVSAEMPEKDFLECLPLWRQVVTSLDRGRCPVIALPRYSGGREILNRLARSYAPTRGLTPITLDLGRCISASGGVNYGTLAEDLSAVRPTKRKVQVIDRAGFENLFKSMIRQRVQAFLVLLSGAGKGREKGFMDVISLLHHLASQQSNGQAAKLAFVAMDDFSFWYFEHYSHEVNVSELWTVQRFALSPLGRDDVLNCVKLLSPDTMMDGDFQATLTDRIFDLTAGHVGLTWEIFDDLESRDWLIHPDYLADGIERLLLNGPTMEGLMRDIQEDPIGLAKTALEYKSRSYAVEYASPRYQSLRRLGILSWQSEASLVLCGGVIGRFVERLAEHAPTKRVGTVQTSRGAKRFEAEEIMLNDDDMVAIHLSDLHVGADHNFR